MDILNFQTVDNLPCLYNEQLDLVVLSDLHLGLERTMSFDGNYIPKHQLKQIREDVREIKDLTGGKKILVNGDLKNEFKTSRHAEKDEINRFLDLLEELFDEIILIKGNHDTFLDETLDKHGLEMKVSHIEGDILFTHGHLSLSKFESKEFETLIIGHEHPSLALKDDIGVKEKIDCFLYGKMGDNKNIVVLPAFSSISNGSKVNETPKSEFLSPILRNQVNLSKLKAVGVSREAGLFDFPELGKLRN